MPQKFRCTTRPTVESTARAKTSKQQDQSKTTRELCSAYCKSSGIKPTTPRYRHNKRLFSVSQELKVLVFLTNSLTYLLQQQTQFHHLGYMRHSNSTYTVQNTEMTQPAVVLMPSLAVLMIERGFDPVWASPCIQLKHFTGIQSFHQIVILKIHIFVGNQVQALELLHSVDCSVNYSIRPFRSLSTISRCFMNFQKHLLIHSS